MALTNSLGVWATEVMSGIGREVVQGPVSVGRWWAGRQNVLSAWDG